MCFSVYGGEFYAAQCRRCLSRNRMKNICTPKAAIWEYSAYSEELSSVFQSMEASSTPRSVADV